MTIRLFNTLTGRIEELYPSDGNALRMYACGHTTSLRLRTHRELPHVSSGGRPAPVSADLEGIVPKHVMNITDVDDKIIRNVRPRPAFDDWRVHAALFEGVLRGSRCARCGKAGDCMARATEHIPSMVIADRPSLRSKDCAYKTEDGSWYFRIAKFPEYGKLSKKDFSGIADGARVDVDEYDKDSARDFALWKALRKPGPSITGRPHWGPGRSLDGISNARPWRQSIWEIASICMLWRGSDVSTPRELRLRSQSPRRIRRLRGTGSTFVFLLVEGRKMSKSENNFYASRPATEGL